MIIYSIAFSEKCNLNCSYCDVDKLSQKSIDTQKAIEGYFELRSKKPTEKIQVDFFGGEPLLHWQKIVEIVNRLESDNCQFFMPTNGLLLTEDKIKFLNEKKIQVSLSFDGLWQDINRPQHNGSGTLKKYLEKIDLFKSINNLECHSMINRGNYDLLDNHLFIKEKLGINSDLTLIRDVGVWDQESVKLVKYGITELLDWYIEHADEEELPGFLKEYLRHILLYRVKNRETHSCGAGESYFSFSENKSIACNRFKDGEGVDKIEEYRSMTPCRTCEVRNYCKKGCLFENIKNEGPIEELCEIYKHIYSELQRMTFELQNNNHFREFMREEIYAT